MLAAGTAGTGAPRLLIFPLVDFILVGRRSHGSTRKASSGSATSLREARSSSGNSSRGAPTGLVLAAGKAERIPRLGRQQQQALGAAWRSWGAARPVQRQSRGVAWPARRRSASGSRGRRRGGFKGHPLHLFSG
ncbi:unnamed protein product [Urochloa humidicola]